MNLFRLGLLNLHMSQSNSGITLFGVQNGDHVPSTCFKRFTFTSFGCRMMVWSPGMKQRKEVKRAAAANSSRCQNSSTHQSHLGSPQNTWCTRAKATSNGSTGGPPERVAIPKSATALSRPSGWLGCACRSLWYRLS